LKYKIVLFILIFLLPFLGVTSGCSCSKKQINTLKKETVKKTNIKTFISPLLVYIKEIKLQRKTKRKKILVNNQKYHVTRKEAMTFRKDIVEMHEFLKKGANLYKEQKYDEALSEFNNVMSQHPEDAHLQVIATKNIAVCFNRLSKMKDIDENLRLQYSKNYVEHFVKYYDLMKALPEDPEDF